MACQPGIDLTGQTAAMIRYKTRGGQPHVVAVRVIAGMVRVHGSGVVREISLATLIEMVGVADQQEDLRTYWVGSFPGYVLPADINHAGGAPEQVPLA